MTKYERHPAPEKLLRQITTEAVNLLALGGPDNIKAAALPEVGVALIVKAWGLPQEDLDASATLIQEQKKLVSGEATLPDDRLLEPYDGGMIAELVWGLFETAIRLDGAEDRQTMYQLALLLADILDFDEWIGQCGPDGPKN
mgnify:CR=1 FL=1